MIHEERLLYKNQVWDDAYVVRNGIFPEEWYGSVLYLGMGMCYNPLKQSDKVTKTTIVEIDKRTIDFNKDKIKSEWVIICDDAFSFEPLEKYDFIFIDIWWQQVEAKIVDDIIERYKKYLTENGQILYLKTIKKK
jgi:spermidine synthase